MDRAMPSAPGIEKYMDFNSVFKKYQSLSLPFYKRTWFKWGIAVVVVAAGVSLVTAGLSAGKTNTAEVKTEKAPVVTAQKMNEESPCINPPVEGAEPAYDSYIISSLRDTVIVTDKGSKLFVPAAVAGKGSFELRIREFSKNAEVFLSGIPMDYDSAGQKYAFQSAGMIEILAYRNGNMVEMENDKSIKVIFKGHDPDKNFNMYCLDTIGKRWNYEGKDVVDAEHLSYPQQNKSIRIDEMEELTTAELKGEMETLRKVVKKQMRSIDSLNVRKPVAPYLADTSAYFFDLKFNETKFPQMKPFKKAHFQVLPECIFFNSSFYTSKWTSVAVTEQIPGQKYVIHVERKKENKKEKFNIPVKPVFVGKAYDSAYAAFSNSFKKYETILANEDEKLKEQQRKLKEYELRIKKSQANNTNNNNGIITINTPANLTAQKLGPEYNVTRMFYANKFGVWNCDKPWPYKQKDEVMVVARDVSGRLLIEGKLYVCDLNKKAMFTYNEKERVKIGMEKGHSYIIWMVDNDQQLHYSLADFKKEALPENKKVVLEMTTLAQVPTDPVKLHKLLGI